MREARLVLPIPPGTHWSDAKPAVLPGMENVNVLPPGSEPEKREKKSKVKKPQAAPQPVSQGLWFAPPPPTPEEIAKAKEEKKTSKPPRPRLTNDPKLVAAARELRDRYTEQINAAPGMPLSACGKYDVSRQLEAARSNVPGAMKIENANLLEAA